MKTEHWLSIAVILVVGAYVVPAIISALPTVLMIVGAFVIVRWILKLFSPSTEE
jgi:hypothetical protein